MRFNFLWDEDKTRKLFKTHLILFLIGGVLATAYTALLPDSTPYRTEVVLVPAIFTISCLIYLLLLPKPNPGIRFLLFNLQSQLAAAVFMALTGGFLGVVQFAPYMFLLFSVFQLGSISTMILGGFSILTFIAVFIWTNAHFFHPNIVQEFLYYVGSYSLIVVIERNIGIELSLQFEAKKRLEQVDDLKNQFIALASHYLRTPLTVIKGFSEELENSDLKSEQKKQVQSISDNAKQLNRLVEELITISSIEKGEAKITKTESNLNDVVSSIVEEVRSIAAEQKITVEYQLTQLPNFAFDPAKLGDAVRSLVDNAIKFNKTGGKIKVSFTQSPAEAVITVSDTGTGIDKEHLKDLFSPFNRGSMQQVLTFDKPGIGLSLYMVKLIIDAHKGSLSVDSTTGEGSTFTIKLPITHA